MIGLVRCIYPDRLDDDGFPKDFLPEGFEEFKSTEFCTHDYCIEAADAHAMWRASGRGMTESERLARQDVGDDIRRLKR